MLKYFKNFLEPDLNNFKINQKRYGYNHTLYQSLNNGRALLGNYNQVRAYKAYYGQLHYYKFMVSFKRFFDNYSDELKTKNISIIDWGCGIGIGIWLLLQKGEEIKHFRKNLKYITLIDFGGYALNSIYMKLKYIRNTDYDFSKVCISKLKADLATDVSLNFENIFNNVKSKKCHIHIFGNILDIKEIDRKNIFNNISKKLKGDNYFICTSPTSTGHARQGISDFFCLFKEKNKTIKPIYDDVESVEAEYHNFKMNADIKKNTTQYLSIFKVNIK